MEEIKVKLDVFEGPLDLLLHLIKKFEIDIYDIPILEITEQYMNYIHTMKTLELELAGEYLVMAATLMAIKSQMLLPKPELELEEDEEVEGEDPRDALVAQLLEYRKFKYAAEVLSEKAEERSLYFTKEPMDISPYQSEQPKKPTGQLNTIDLFFAFHQMLEKKRKKQPLETTIMPDNVSIEEKMSYIEKQLKRVSKNGQSFESFFTSYTKADIVTTFMALLELMKSGSIRAEQSDNYSQITLFPIDRSNEDE